MNSTTKNILCTRIFDEQLKIKAYQNSFIISDFEFVKSTYFVNEVLADVLMKNEKTIVFTSKHALNSIEKIINYYNINLLERKCFCIKGQTSEMAESKGYEVIDTATNAEKLAQKIIDAKEKKVLHFTSNIKRKELYDILEEAEIEIESRESYDKSFNEYKLKAIDGIMFFSPSQIDAYLIKNDLDKNIPAFCIGATTAKHLKNKKHNNILTANIASEASILQSVDIYFQEQS